jgi:beta-fructofuranosidase
MTRPSQEIEIGTEELNTRRSRITRREFIGAATAMVTSAVLPSADLMGEIPQSNSLASDRHRPRFHLMPPSLWLNDPNGPLHFKGRYHLFYQYAPQISNSATKYWGHAVSTDMVHWKNLGIALAPTSGGPDKNGCWTGSALVVNGVPTIVYTGGTWSAENERAERAKGIIPERQLVAVAADPNDPDLIKWNKIPENPVLKAPPDGIKAVGWRDPAVWREDDTWYMTIGCGEVGKGGIALLYNSKDIKHWNYLHPLAIARPNPNQDTSRPFNSMWECPDFFLLKNKPFLLVAAGNRYLTGTYVEHRFEQQDQGRVDFGSSAYAQKTMEDEKGRRIWWAWLREKRISEAQVTAGWAGVMSLPKLLTLRKDGLLGIEPVPELEVLRRDHKKISGHNIEPNGPLVLKGVGGDCVEIEVEIDLGDAHQAGVRVRAAADGSEQTVIGYDRDKQELFSDTTGSSTDPATASGLGFRRNRGIESGQLILAKGEPLRLRVYVDASVIETFANGRTSISDRVYPTHAATLGIGLFAKGGTARLRSMTVWHLDPISRDRLTSGAELFKV